MESSLTWCWNNGFAVCNLDASLRRITVYKTFHKSELLAMLQFIVQLWGMCVCRSSVSRFVLLFIRVSWKWISRGSAYIISSNSSGCALYLREGRGPHSGNSCWENDMIGDRRALARCRNYCRVIGTTDCFVSSFWILDTKFHVV